MQYTRNLHAHKTQYNRYTTGDLRLVFSHRLHNPKKIKNTQKNLSVPVDWPWLGSLQAALRCAMTLPVLRTTLRCLQNANNGRELATRNRRILTVAEHGFDSAAYTRTYPLAGSIESGREV